MGYPGKAKKLYDTPNHPWQKARIEEETGIVKKYGLRNKKGVWKFASELRKYRGNARELLGVMAAGNLPEDSHYIRDANAIVRKLQLLGVLKEDAKLEDILALKIDDLLERRLQTMVFRKGYANSMKQSRQFIVHGHISVNGRKTTIPSYMVLKADEECHQLLRRLPDHQGEAGYQAHARSAGRKARTEGTRAAPAPAAQAAPATPAETPAAAAPKEE